MKVKENDEKVEEEKKLLKTIARQLLALNSFKDFISYLKLNNLLASA